MQNDLEPLGYVLEYGKVDTQNFLLPQRRNRIYATADVSLGQTAHDYGCAMQATMDQLASDALIDTKKIFDESLPKSWLTTERQTAKLKEALEGACLREGSQDVFIDASTSNSRVAEYAVNVLTCVRPSHQIYSQRLERWVSVREMFAAQGLFQVNFANGQAVEDVLQNPTLAQDLAGNAFSATVMQAKMLASLVHSQGWSSIAQHSPRREDAMSHMSSSFKKSSTCGSIMEDQDSGSSASISFRCKSMPLMRKRSAAEISSDDLGAPAAATVPVMPVLKRARGKTRPQDVGPAAAARCIVSFNQDDATGADCKAGLEILRKRSAQKRHADPIADGGEPSKKRKYTTNGTIARDGKGSVVSIWRKLILLNVFWLYMYN